MKEGSIFDSVARTEDHDVEAPGDCETLHETLTSAGAFVTSLRKRCDGSNWEIAIPAKPGSEITFYSSYLHR